MTPAAARLASGRPDAFTWFMGLLDAVGSAPLGRTVRQCPGHLDAAPSLSVGRGADGRVLIRCHAGCSTQQVLAALHCPPVRLFEPASSSPDRFARTFCRDLTFPQLERRPGQSLRETGYRLEAVHDYGPDFRMLRWRNGTDKQLRWESRNEHGEMVPGLLGRPVASLPIYLERDAIAAVALGMPVVIVESESSVDALTAAGVMATTWAGGANTVQVPALRRVLDGYPRLVVIPDHDGPGMAALDALRAAGLAPRVELPEPGEDARDLLNRLGPARFRALIGTA